MDQAIWKAIIDGGTLVLLGVIILYTFKNVIPKLFEAFASLFKQLKDQGVTFALEVEKTRTAFEQEQMRSRVSHAERQKEIIEAAMRRADQYREDSREDRDVFVNAIKEHTVAIQEFKSALKDHNETHHKEGKAA